MMAGRGSRRGSHSGVGLEKERIRWMMWVIRKCQTRFKAEISEVFAGIACQKDWFRKKESFVRASL
jgi:hypothetical protein